MPEDRPTPSRPTSEAERDRLAHLADRLFPDGLPKDLFKNDGPHYREMIALLKQYNGTPQEREVWDIYYRHSRLPPDQRARVEAEAKAEGMTAQEFIARTVVDEIRSAEA